MSDKWTQSPSFNQQAMLTRAYMVHGKQAGWANESPVGDEIKAAALLEYILGESVLDVACAIGTYTNLAQKLAWTVGIDVNEYLLSKARAQHPHLPFIQGSITHLPFANKSFDTSIAFDILEHVPEHEALRELIRVTRKRLIMCVPHTTDAALHALFVLYGHHADTTHLRTYTPESMQTLLDQHHLSKVVVDPIHPLSTDGLFLSLLNGAPLLKRLARKISFILAKPKRFYTNILIVADIH